MRHTKHIAFLTTLAAIALAGLVLTADAQVEHPPVYRDAVMAEGTVGPLGGVYELTGTRYRPMLVIPSGVFERTHAMSFGIEGRLQADEVHEDFRAVGPTLRLSQAIDARDRPVEVSIRAPRPDAETRSVLAIERTTLCEDVYGGPSVCSHWDVVDTHFYDGRVRARVPVTEGWRLQFGTMTPAAPGSS